MVSTYIYDHRAVNREFTTVEEGLEVREYKLVLPYAELIENSPLISIADASFNQEKLRAVESVKESLCFYLVCEVVTKITDDIGSTQYLYLTEAMKSSLANEVDSDGRMWFSGKTRSAVCTIPEEKLDAIVDTEVGLLSIRRFLHEPYNQYRVVTVGETATGVVVYTGCDARTLACLDFMDGQKAVLNSRFRSYLINININYREKPDMGFIDPKVTKRYL